MSAIRNDETGPLRITCIPPRWITAKGNTYSYYANIATNVLVAHVLLACCMLAWGGFFIRVVQ